MLSVVRGYVLSPGLPFPVDFNSTVILMSAVLVDGPESALGKKNKE
jgi:hypothetical protein